MTLIEIAKQAKPNRLFKHDADDAECYFDDFGVIMVRDEEDYDFDCVLTQEEIVSDKWHFIEE